MEPVYRGTKVFRAILFIIIIISTEIETMNDRSVCDLLSTINCRIFTKFGIGCPYRIYRACLIFVKIGSVICML